MTLQGKKREGDLVYAADMLKEKWGREIEGFDCAGGGFWNDVSLDEMKRVGAVVTLCIPGEVEYELLDDVSERL